MYFIEISFIRISFNRFDVGDKIYMAYTLHRVHTDQDRTECDKLSDGNENVH